VKLSQLETLVLSATSDDYESLAWLTKGRREELGDAIDETMVEDCLRRLARDGLVDVFHYDPKAAKHDFVPCSFESGKPAGELWFYITKKGCEAVEENWNSEWNDL